MDFDNAIEEMKAHPEKKFAREGWNEKRAYIQLQAPDEHSGKTSPSIFMVTDKRVSNSPDAPKGRIRWSASHADLISDDWIEVAPTPFGLLRKVNSDICPNTARELREYS